MTSEWYTVLIASYCLPDTATISGHHRLSDRTSEGLSKFRLILHCSDHAELHRRVRIRAHHVTHVFRALLSAEHLGEPEIEPLLRCVALKLFLADGAILEYP